MAWEAKASPGSPPRFVYRPLSQGSIRLLRLLPHRGGTLPIEAQLFDCPLLGSEGSYPYEALSYVWGSEEQPLSISLDDGCGFPVGTNLHAALSHLRNHFVDRILWVDAICIDQSNPDEKSHQVRLMAKVYAMARSVLIWLGAPSADSEQAIECVRVAAASDTAVSPASPASDAHRKAVLALLQRPWLQRIWVLQEAAAARHVLIKCGTAEIDGYVFCLGLGKLRLSFEACPDREDLVRSATYLIRDAPLRPRSGVVQPGPSQRAGGYSLSIRPLGELMDIFHTRKATRLHDKIYALLGMSTDDPVAGGLLVDYKASWADVFRALVCFLLSDTAQVSAVKNREAGVIRTKGRLVGFVESVATDSVWPDRWNVHVTWSVETEAQTAPLMLTASAKLIQPGDAICLLASGGPCLSVVRLRQDYCSVIRIAVSPPKSTTNKSASWAEYFPALSLSHDFLLVWDWTGDPGQLDNDQGSNYFADILASPSLNSGWEECLDKTMRLLSTCRLLLARDGLDGKVVEQRIPAVLEACEQALAEMEKSDDPRRPLALQRMEAAFLDDREFTMTMLRVAFKSGFCATSKMLFNCWGADSNAKFEESLQLLFWAASVGSLATAKLLRDVGVFENHMRLIWPAALLESPYGSSLVVVKLLLNADIVSPNVKWASTTALEIALMTGQSEVAKILADDTRTDISPVLERVAKKRKWDLAVQAIDHITRCGLDGDDGDAMTPATRAASRAHLQKASQILAAHKANPDVRYEGGETALMQAIRWERGRVAREHNIEQFKACINYVHGEDGDTALSLAAQHGGSNLVAVLLGADAGLDVEDAGPGVEDAEGYTAFVSALLAGTNLVQLLLSSSAKTDVDATNNEHLTALMIAAQYGDCDIVTLLLNAGTDASRCLNEEAILWALKGYAFWKQPWERKVDYDATLDVLLRVNEAAASKYLLGLVEQWNGEKAPVLLRPYAAQLDAEHVNGQTPLTWALCTGRRAIGHLILNTGEIFDDPKNKIAFTPLLAAMTESGWPGPEWRSEALRELIHSGKLVIEGRIIHGKPTLVLVAPDPVVDPHNRAAVESLLAPGGIDPRHQG